MKRKLFSYILAGVMLASNIIYPISIEAAEASFSGLNIASVESEEVDIADDTVIVTIKRRILFHRSILKKQKEYWVKSDMNVLLKHRIVVL